MFELIIERPRRDWGRGGNLKGRRREHSERALDRAAAWEPVSRGRGTKGLTDNLSPLVRFLGSSVGRPWDDVYSELCAALPAGGTMHQHVRDHVRDLVETAVVYIDGRPHHALAGGSRRDRYQPITAWRGRRFYVCPDTGVLEVAPPWGPRAAKTTNPDVRRLDAATELRRIEGVWYRVEYAPIPDAPAAWSDCVDAVLRRSLAASGMLGYGGALQQYYGRCDRYAKVKRQLSRRELRRLVG